MAHTGIFATSDEILVKAGSKYDTAITEARINALCLQAEGYINSVTRYNWSDAFSGLNSDFKGILSELESDLVAMYIIMFNRAVYTNGEEAECMLDLYTDRTNKIINYLTDIKTQDFINNA